MAPTLIVLVLAAVVIGFVIWFIRRKSSRTYAQSLEQDTAWNDSMSENEPERRPAPPSAEDQEPRP